MIPWTPAARQELRRHAALNRGTMAAAGADPAEVLEDYERHITQEATSAGLNVVTEADVRRLLARLGIPAAESAPGAVSADEPGNPSASPRRKPSLWLALGGVVLPLVTLAIELVAGACAGAFFDPLPTGWHVLLVAIVPLANALALRALRSGVEARWRWLTWLLGTAVGVGFFYSTLFAPMVLPGLLGVVFYGFGLLPLTPVIGLVCTVFIWSHWRRAVPPGDAVSSRRFWVGAAAGLAVLMALDAPSWITRRALALATSDEPEEQRRGLQWLRWFGREESLRRECYGRTRNAEGLDLVGWLTTGSRRINAEQARELYYRVFGQPFNSVPAPKVRTARGIFAELDDWTWDDDQGGQRVGGRLKGLTLHGSRLDAVVEPDAALAYLEWTLEFKNASRQAREARAQIQLPPGSVVSRLTLWIDGEEREAAFAGRAQTREAYQEVAIRKRRDPVLVTTSGPDRVLMQCFPVPADGGTMRVRLGITAPVQLDSAAAGRLPWPAFIERNFTVAEPFRHSVWVESQQGLEAESTALHAETPRPGTVAVRGLVRDGELSSSSNQVRVIRDPAVQRVWTPALPATPPAFVQATLAETNLPAPTRLVMVVDASRGMQPHLEAVVAALDTFPATTELAVLMASDEPSLLAEAAARDANGNADVSRLLARATIHGGQDNLPALVRAWDLAAQRSGACILWIHAPQPVLLSSTDVLHQAFERRRQGPMLLDYQVAPGPNRILDALDGVSSLEVLPRGGNVAADLRQLFASWQNGRKQVRMEFERTQTEPGVSASIRKVSSHLARLWALEQVRWLQGARRVPEAVDLAAAHQLVTPVSGAVVLETAQQYERHGLTPADPMSVPSIPEPGVRALLLLGLAVLWLRRRRIPRRCFLQRLTLAPAVLAGWKPSPAAEPAARRLRFGVIADIHPDVLPDGLERVQSFVSAMTGAGVDFIIQLGDFVWPAPTNHRYLDAWNRFAGPRHHVLGNHDLDEGYTREQTVAFCGMPAMHYAFPAGPARGLVLDGNEPGGKRPGYKRFMGPTQLAWLEHELAGSDKPCLLFIHEPFDTEHDDALENAAAVRAVLEKAEQARPGTVLAVFSGHFHLDYARVVNGIRYFGINSAAYWWLNNPAARREVYAPEVHKTYRYASHVAPYREALWATVTLDLDRGELVIEGRRSEWLGPDPWARGETTDRPREFLQPWISDRRVRLT